LKEAWKQIFFFGRLRWKIAQYKELATLIAEILLILCKESYETKIKICSTIAFVSTAYSL
jgi:hypothetical protein